METIDVDLLFARPKEALAVIDRRRVCDSAIHLSSHASLLAIEMMEPNMYGEEIELEWCIDAARSWADCFRNFVTMGSSNVRSKLVWASKSRYPTILNAPDHRTRERFLFCMRDCNVSL